MVRSTFKLVLLLALAGAWPLSAALPLTPQTPAGVGQGRGGVPIQGAEEDIPLVARFDRNNDKRLDYGERTAAREYLTAHPELRRPVRGGRNTRTGTPGPRLSPNDVKSSPASIPLYDTGTLRTLFLEFERPDWEQELAAFYHTDVEVPATLTMDGKVYRDVGVSFRGNNSFTAVPDGLKRPLSISMDAWRNQHLLGHRSLNLLNANQDPTLLRSMLFLEVARDYIPTVKANFMRVAINGESWGVYVNQQTFSTEFLREAFKATRGTRWKSPNNSVGGGFSYLGEDVAEYRRWYEMKGGDDPAAWRALIRATKVLNETPAEGLEQALASVFDVDETLRYLALDVALVNNDGYWRDGSDFNLYLNEQGRFLFTLHDANEGFRTGGRAGGAAQPEPLTTLDDPNKALRHKLLAVPALRTRYLKYVGEIAEKWLDWRRLGPIVEKYDKLIGGEVALETRKLDTTEAFKVGIYGPGDGTPPPASTIKGFADLRRVALLGHPDIVKARGGQETPADYQGILKTLGKTGDYRDGVFKVNIPRSDLAVMIKGRAAPTPFGFGGWLAFSKGDGGHDVMMGDLVLTEDEVNPVLSALLASGLTATALHNHFFWESPRIFYMHVHGHGMAADLAAKVKPAVDLIGRGAPAPTAAAAAPVPGSLDTAALAKIIGFPGEQNGPVFKITIGRPDITMREMGAVINARMGLNTWAAFAGTTDDAMIAGDVAMLETEVTPVLQALRRHNLNLVAMHHHMVNTRPVVIFLHYWGQGRAPELAAGVRAALDVIGRK